MTTPLGFIDIASTNPAKSAAFYEGVLGFETEPGQHTRFNAGNVAGGFPDLQHGFAPVIAVLEPGDVVPYFEPADLDAALARTVELGGSVLLDPVESAPGHWVAIVADPSGAKIALTRIEQRSA
jgi:predicted enzyme related to lactoylglutathione lyase